LLLSFTRLQAQINLPSYDRQKLRFGFLVGFNNSNLKVFPKQEFYKTDTLFQATPLAGPGFNIGIVTNVLLWRYVDLRFTPNLGFVDRQIEYKFADATKNTIKGIESTYIELPLDFKLRSIRHRNVGFYVIGGVRASYDIISQKMVNIFLMKQLVKLNFKILIYLMNGALDGICIINTLNSRRNLNSLTEQKIFLKKKDIYILVH
jgi:hypothetical protein